MADIRTFGAIPDGTTDCTAAIQNAINAGNIEIQNGIFLISSSIKIPSNRTITGKNAVLKLADESYDNFFRNSDFVNGNSNIIIKGLGNFCLDGNSANNDDDYAAYGPILPWPPPDTIYRYMGIVMCNVDTFGISGLDIVDYSHWFIFLQKATNGIVKDIYFNYFTETANQDGIDILAGCNNISISNIRGFTGDDLFALSVGNKSGVFVDVDDWDVGDIHDILIDNVNLYSSLYHAFITLAGDGNKIYNITASNFKVYACSFFCYFGLTGYYTTPPAKTDVYGFTFDNVTLLTQADAGAAIRALEDCKDIAFTDWVNSSGKPDYYEAADLDVENFTINGVQQSV